MRFSCGYKNESQQTSDKHSLFAEKRAINSDLVFFLSVESLVWCCVVVTVELGGGSVVLNVVVV